MDPNSIEYLQKALIRFYDESARVLPWRENKDPYRIWVSEIMLQQTQVKTVIPYYERFLKRLPTVADLAATEEEELLKLWEGLGYYSRVKNLHKAAKSIVLNGTGSIPTTVKELMELPGIGEYTAGAIASIAYETRVAAVDGNVHRVITRYLGLDLTKDAVLSLMDAILPSKRIGDFNQSIMELGARICLPVAKPACQECPLNLKCVACLAGLTDSLPVKVLKEKRKIDLKTLLILTDSTHYVIRKRPKKGLLAGLWEFPMVEGHGDLPMILTDFENSGYRTVETIQLPDSKHVFTHREWLIKAFLVKSEFPQVAQAGFVHATLAELKEHYALSSLFDVYLEKLT